MIDNELYKINKLARLSWQIFNGYYINSDGNKIICRKCNKEYDISSDTLNQQQLIEEISIDAETHIIEGLKPVILYFEKQGWSRKTVTIN